MTGRHIWTMMARLYMSSVRCTLTWHTCMSDRSNRLSRSADWLNPSFDFSVVLIRTLDSQFLALRHGYDQMIPSVHMSADVDSESRNAEHRSVLPN
ncbi:hypothetical protein NITLEN_20394 [Nitrospira lenta]|uniref:Uncharacterized protein n=1 Tax=Nitrospira lenta TaxID=1436998 RepID=A0A330L4J5_9BACT|nr:hypothetical protein NITLEN_20394 [Nitrospira lenta]